MLRAFPPLPGASALLRLLLSGMSRHARLHVRATRRRMPARCWQQAARCKARRYKERAKQRAQVRRCLRAQVYKICAGTAFDGACLVEACLLICACSRRVCPLSIANAARYQPRAELSPCAPSPRRAATVEFIFSRPVASLAATLSRHAIFFAVTRVAHGCYVVDAITPMTLMPSAHSARALRLLPAPPPAALCAAPLCAPRIAATYAPHATSGSSTFAARRRRTCASLLRHHDHGHDIGIECITREKVQQDYAVPRRAPGECLRAFARRYAVDYKAQRTARERKLGVEMNRLGIERRCYWQMSAKMPLHSARAPLRRSFITVCRAPMPPLRYDCTPLRA